MKTKKKLRGYAFSREAGGQFVPQRLQNMIIRGYAQDNGYEFLLSACEYYMDNCYMMLESLLDKIDQVDGLVFYSFNYLPDNKEHRKRIYKRILDAGKELHFALENLSIKNQKDVGLMEEILAVRDLSGGVGV